MSARIALSLVSSGLFCLAFASLTPSVARAETVHFRLENRTSEVIHIKLEESVGAGRYTIDTLNPGQRKYYSETTRRRGGFSLWLTQSGGSGATRWMTRQLIHNDRSYVINHPGEVTDVGRCPATVTVRPAR